MKPTKTFPLSVLCLLLLMSAPSPADSAIFTVDSDGTAADATPGDGYCATSGGECTLRAAIEEANVISNTIILFDDQYSIDSCYLPALTGGSITLNAYDQWNTTSDQPGVTLTSNTCDLLTIESDNNNVFGLFFIGGDVIGVNIAQGGNNTIGTDATHHRNVFLVGKYSVWVQPFGSGNTVAHNYIGTVSGDTLISGGIGQRGIYVGWEYAATNATIDSNVIGGQSEAAIYVWGTGNTITNNYLGVTLDKQGTLPNTTGILLYADENEIGPNNIIGGNTAYGIRLDYGADNNNITSNDITYRYAIADLGNTNHGIYINGGTGNTLSNNKIFDNDGSGIYAYYSSDLTLYNNSIGDNSLHGVHLVGTTATIGGSGTGQPNFVYGNLQHGIYLQGSSATTIAGNLIGQSSGGTDQGNQWCGIALDSGAANNIIGGDSADAGNWIGWNQLDGVKISGSTSTGNVLKNNVFGAPTGWNWQAANQQHAIALYDGANNNTIGATDNGNVVLASGGNGLYLENSDNNSIAGNKIGTDGDTHDWGNSGYGIDLQESAGNSVTGNEIANNGGAAAEAGIRVYGSGAVNNTISANSIYDNSGKGIELASGGNQSLAAPTTGLSGQTVSGTTCASCTVEVFSDGGDEGRYYEDSVSADANGDFSWTGDPQGEFITTTVTDTNGNTSEFSTALSAPTFSWQMFLPAIIHAGND